MTISAAARTDIRRMAADLREAEATPPERFPGHKNTYCLNLACCLGRYALPLLNALEAAEADAAEALRAVDDYAAKDLDHELHAIVEHYGAALGIKDLIWPRESTPPGSSALAAQRTEPASPSDQSPGGISP